MGSEEPNGLAVNDALRVLLPAAVYVLALAIYAFFVFKFYRFIANRDIIRFDLSARERSSVPVLRTLLSLIGYAAKFLILFPAFAFVWFATLTVMLALLATNLILGDVLLIALVVVCAVRVCAYYDEDLARDLAKILPFAVLSAVLVGGSSLDVLASLTVLTQVGRQWEVISYYWLFLVGVETVLRLVFGVGRGLFPGKRPDQSPKQTTDNSAVPTSDD